MYKNDVLVTIITPSYNQGLFIESTIQSVLNQTYKNIEYIVIDACSTDQTVPILEKYRGKIDKIVVEKDKGQTDAINKGFKMANGDLVAWINSDDILYPECVERIVEAYKINPIATIYYNSICNIIDKHGVNIGVINRPIQNRDFLLRRKFEVLQPGSFYNSITIKKVNYLDESINYCMDLDLWLKLSVHGNIVDIKGTPLSAYRDWELTKTNNGSTKFYKEIFITLMKHGARLIDKSVIKVQFLIFKSILKDTIK